MGDQTGDNSRRVSYQYHELGNTEPHHLPRRNASRSQDTLRRPTSPQLRPRRICRLPAHHPHRLLLCIHDGATRLVQFLSHLINPPDKTKERPDSSQIWHVDFGLSLLSSLTFFQQSNHQHLWYVNRQTHRKKNILKHLFSVTGTWSACHNHNTRL